jgi:hypothetical protein
MFVISSDEPPEFPRDRLKRLSAAMAQWPYIECVDEKEKKVLEPVDGIIDCPSGPTDILLMFCLA